MNTYYVYITVHGISSLLQIHYQTRPGDTWVHVYNWYDRHGDSPDLTDQQIHRLAREIAQYESQLPLGEPAQQNLSLEFNERVA